MAKPRKKKRPTGLKKTKRPPVLKPYVPPKKKREDIHKEIIIKPKQTKTRGKKTKTIKTDTVSPVLEKRKQKKYGVKIKTRNVSKGRAGRLAKRYSKPNAGPGKRTRKQSILYGAKAILSAGAVVGAMLGGKKLVEKIKGKVKERKAKRKAKKLAQN